MAKGIAIQTILMLAIGVLVVGILGYMIYRYTSGSVLSDTECHAMLSQWCQQCELTDYNLEADLGDGDLLTCAQKFLSTAYVANDDCNTYGGGDNAEDTIEIHCAQYIPS